jgi:hypothetical protein
MMISIRPLIDWIYSNFRRKKPITQKATTKDKNLKEIHTKLIFTFEPTDFWAAFVELVFHMYIIAKLLYYLRPKNDK